VDVAKNLGKGMKRQTFDRHRFDIEKLATSFFVKAKTQKNCMSDTKVCGNGPIFRLR